MERVKYQKFQHTVNFKTYDKLMNYYSNLGSYIPVYKYWELRRRDIDDATIWLDHAKKYTDSKIKQDNWPNISSLKELMTYIYGQLNKEQQKKVQEGKKKTKELKDMIKLFPECYLGILLLRLDYDNGIGQKNTRKMDTVIETIGKHYNPDAWIGGE